MCRGFRQELPTLRLLAGVLHGRVEGLCGVLLFVDHCLHSGFPCLDVDVLAPQPGADQGALFGSTAPTV